MRFDLTAATLAGIALASPAFAADPVMAPVRPPPAAVVFSPISGDVTFFGGFLWGDDDEHAGLFGGEGRFAWQFSNSLVLQGDVSGTTTTSDDFELGITSFSLTKHLYTRSATSAFGVKAGVSNWYVVNALMAGGEGHLFLGNLTLGADVNYTHLLAADEGIVQLRGLARYYLNPNTRLQFDAAWYFVTNGGSSNAWTLAGAVSHRFSGSPVALTGRVQYDNWSGGSVDTWSGTIGVTYNIDPPGSTLMSHDRNNVVFDQLRPVLPVVFTVSSP